MSHYVLHNWGSLVSANPDAKTVAVCLATAYEKQASLI